MNTAILLAGFWFAARGDAPKQNTLGPARDEFAARLTKELAQGSSKGNLCFSPISMQICLSTLLNGVGGNSIEPVKQTLRVGSASLDQVNDANRDLVHRLVGPNVTIANSIWLRTETKPKPAFLDRLREDYSADYFAVADLDAARPRINAWTNDHTKGRIRSLFDSPFRQALAVLVNTVTFDAKWQTEFDPKRTQVGEFRTSSGETVRAQMMHAQDKFANVMSDGAMAVELPYAGGEYSMVCVLPPPTESVYQFALALAPDGIRSLTAGMVPSQIDVALPRFKFSAAYDMVGPLGRMGLQPLYRGIDLSGISSGLAHGPAISQIVQKTWIKVDEQGTQAAAASGIVMSKAIRLGFVANRPFVFAIMHKQTGAILFFGIMDRPIE